MSGGRCEYEPNRGGWSGRFSRVAPRRRLRDVSGQPVAHVAVLLFNQGMATVGDWPWLLLDALDATAQQADQLHLDLCPI